MLTGVETRIVASGEVMLSVLEAGPPGQPTIVFVHGYPDTKAVWAPMLERLAADFHVVAYDVRGAGASSAPRGPAAYRLERLADDFAAVCAAVAPGARVHLVGHDWGGIQGWEFATAPRFAGQLVSFTTIAGPALAHASRAVREAVRRGEYRTAVERLRRSWYIVPLCVPGGPTLAWRGVLGGSRWPRALRLADGVAATPDYPAATVIADGLHGANLYRRNILPLAARRAPLRPAHVPVQVIVPTGDRFISTSYYDAVALAAPGARRRSVESSHWAPRQRPEQIAAWVSEFVREVDAGKESVSG